MSISRDKIFRIYIPLLDEGTPVVRPTSGEEVGDNVFRLLPADYTTTENWKFKPGTIVRCVREVWSGNEILVAREVFTETNES